jgi:hypothetical protein
MDRREFLAKAGLVATWAAISVRISGCGSDESNPMNGGGDGDVEGDVSVESPGAHTHNVTITGAQIEAGNAVTLTLALNDIYGHTHQVSLTGDQVMAIGAGTSVVAQSTDSSGHSHTVSFNV